MASGPCCCPVHPSEEPASSHDDHGRGHWQTYLPGLQILFSAASLIPGFYTHLFGHANHHVEHGGLAHFFLDPAWVAILLCGVPMLGQGVRDLVRGRLTVSVLVATAIAATISIGDLFAAGEIAFIMTLGEMLEQWTIRRARSGIEKLIRLTPQTARRLEDEHEHVVPLAEIRSDDRLRVLPGETIPVDGIIISGNSSIDEQLISGEPLPVDKGPGDALFCGTINRYGALAMEATGVGADSSLARMIRLVRDAEVKKAPMERIADRWAGYIVPAALLTALCVGLLTGDYVRGVTILVVFCPCALVLATPTAIVAAIGNAARYGILVRSGETLERLGKVDTVAFDKTGTLTRGEPSLSIIRPVDDSMEPDRLLVLAASLEQLSDHPLSLCIVQAARERELAFESCEHGELMPGYGMTGCVGERKLLIGNAALLRNNGLEPVADGAVEAAERGETLVWIAEIEPVKQLLGFLTVTDTLRSHAADTVRAAKEENCRVLLLTGDHAQAAETVAVRIGIAKNDVHAELRPEEKLAAIRQLQEQHRCVAMVGDGINDAPALKMADVGIAMGTAGSDLAIEAADVTLVGEDITRVPFLIRLSHKTRATIIGNILFSIIFNIVAVILATAGLIDPAIGALLHNGSSIVVVLNASLLLHVRRDERSAG